ncbi:hypothetical protein [Phenylobacterium sp. SCN 70-31]|uniref:hypothetical protein n=1 Tax=Phenylobacterium sp. SCN 70-31 TaxID=1660129 RepID=UPI00086858D9|nr:hypothetical protein [Phenylobacterium sp. SCN 70-31]ODT88663.1 MAG: hypothetical protein ABS78_05755 [Phenylobacterium sp. SCN 70-31]
MRSVVLGAVAAILVAGVAHAADFVVVSSTEPGVARGQEFAAGTLVQIAPGKSVVLIDTAGQVVRLNGAAGQVIVPRRQYASVNEDRVAVLKMLVGPPRVRRAAPGLGKVCPETDMTAFDGIVTVAQVDGCLTTARTAFEAYVDKALVSTRP